MGMTQLIIEVLLLAGKAWEQHTTGGAKNTALLAETLLKIAQKATAGYEAQVGKPIDLSLLKTIPPLDSTFPKPAE